MFQKQNLQSNPQQKRFALIYGMTGSGKTHLFNSLTGSKRETNYGQENVNIGECQFGSRFILIDTQGLDDSMNFTSIFYASLTIQKLSAIIMVVNLEREELLFNKIKKLIKPFIRFQQLITIAITQYDKLKYFQSESERVRFKEEIKQQIEDRFQINSVVLTEKDNYDAMVIAYQLDSILTKNEPLNISFSQNEMMNCFLFDNCSESIDQILSNRKIDKIMLFQKKQKCMIKFIRDCKEKKNELDQLMHYVTLDIKNIATQTLREFENENYQIYDQISDSSKMEIAFTAHSELKTELQSLAFQVIKEAQQKILMEGSTWLENFIKCPNCQQIWQLSELCKGKTVCGSIPDKKINDSYQPYKLFQSIWKTNGCEYSVQKLENNMNQIKPRQQNNAPYFSKINLMNRFWSFFGFKQEHNISKIGCGLIFQQDEVPKINLYDLKQLKSDSEILAQLSIDYDIKDYALVKGQIKSILNKVEFVREKLKDTLKQL